jgi:hypothetical protein
MDVALETREFGPQYKVRLAYRWGVPCLHDLNGFRAEDLPQPVVNAINHWLAGRLSTDSAVRYVKNTLLENGGVIVD